MTYGSVLVALADPTRRTIFERLHRPRASTCWASVAISSATATEWCLLVDC